MKIEDDLDIFLVTAPGLESLLCAEAVEKGDLFVKRPWVPLITNRWNPTVLEGC